MECEQLKLCNQMLQERLSETMIDNLKLKNELTKVIIENTMLKMHLESIKREIEFYNKV